MTPERSWLNIEIDHLKSVSSFDVSKDEELRETFIWNNTQPFLKEVLQQKETKFIFFDYRLQFKRPYQCIRRNDEKEKKCYLL